MNNQGYEFLDRTLKIVKAKQNFKIKKFFLSFNQNFQSNGY